IRRPQRTEASRDRLGRARFRRIRACARRPSLAWRPLGHSRILRAQMKVSVIGTGYVGLVAAAAFADHGNDVICADIDEAKIKGLEAGVIPIYEPGLEPLVKRNNAAGRLRFTTSNAEAAAHAEVIFLAVGTPSGGTDGAPKLDYL